MSFQAPNRLANEKSPYLLQHAHNPVSWYPWGSEAFEKAKSEDKPIFLSIGYSTCHWCHVMEHESFEDAQVAKILNDDFISIKVDREERPDIDAVYMEVCQALTGQGGWPMTIIMTPEQKPFFAATYLPKSAGRGMNGMMELLPEIARLWKTERAHLVKSGNDIVAFIKRETKDITPLGEPSKKLFSQATEYFSKTFDNQNGGFGSAPKFPTPHNLLFLLRYCAIEKDEKILAMAEKTLEQMYRGGIFDHIGGGFSRYSTDTQWLAPHFEKMLYDNALLGFVYLEAYQNLARPLYKFVVRRVLDYVLRELTNEEGGFYCGQDADSDGVEGKYYVFTVQEIKSVLGEADGSAFCDWFAIHEEGNFEGKNIPNLLENKDYDQENQVIEKLCEKLYDYRLQRTKLHKDDKILTAWNSLMIAALAKASLVLGEPRYLAAARAAQLFIQNHLIQDDGRLAVRWREGEAAGEGKLEDYAFYGWALLQLYEATFDLSYLTEAIRVSSQMVEHFFDQEKGGFYLYASDGEQLITRPKELYDGAMPSGNSVAAAVLLKLDKLTAEKTWRELSQKQLGFIAARIADSPAAHTFSLTAMLEVLYPSQEMVCSSSDPDISVKLREFMRERYLPNLTILLKTKDNCEALGKVAPFTQDYPIPGEGSAFYLCQGASCSAAVYSFEDLIREISP